MLRILLGYACVLIASVPALFRSRREQVVVELTLRQQLAVYSRAQPRPRLATADRAFWVALRRLWPRWRACLVLVQPETVVRWHREGFRLYWRFISKRGPGRPRISPEVQDLIRRMATENPWRARRIQAELEKLGIEVSLATVSRYLPERDPDDTQRQRWRTFLENHRDAIAAMDFLVVPTVCFKLLYVWFVIGHGRREILHVNVTAHPTTAWVIQQLREALPGDHSSQYLIHDNDSIFSDEVAGAITSFGIEARKTAFRSPWQNGLAERWVGTVKRDLLDHVIVFDEAQLRRLVRDYVAYYNTERVHTIVRDAPTGRTTRARPASTARVVGQPRLGGIHHCYEWQVAA